MRPRHLLVAAGAMFVLFGCSDDLPTGTDTIAEAPTNPSYSLTPAATDAHDGVPARAATYEVTIENLTPAGSQPFSPPVLATHNRSMHVFRTGAFASEELAQVAEDAVNGPLVTALENSRRVYGVATGGAPIPPGASDTFEIHAAPGRQWLSTVFMLVNTNDAFSGVDGARLPMWGERTWMVGAYDAGSEENTELEAHIPGPCCGNGGVRVPTHERIRMHEGILGVGDLDPAAYNWDDPVARITVRRVMPAYMVTIENLTEATVMGGSQVFSPPVLATHRPNVIMWSEDEYASDALALIAEDGDTGPMQSLLSGLDAVHDVTASADPIPPGASDTFEISGGAHASFLSSAFMLVNTNDAFSGTDRAKLPAGGSVMYYVDAYDAGSEQNTELEAHIPGPCCGNPGAGPDEHEPIGHHAGIMGTGDLSPDDYGWDDPVAKLTIKRIR